MGRPPRITRDQLLTTARSVFAAKGFEATTLADIALKLDVTPAAVLRHFDSKQALFAEAMSSGAAIDVPDFIRELASIDAATADPRKVLRGIGERFIPFVQRVIGQNIAVYMHRRSQSTSFVVPFDTASGESPPRRGLPIVEDYFRRAAAAGVMRLTDPRAAALIFMGSLQSYVFIHQILHLTPKPYPLDRYLDSLIELWTDGAIIGRADGGNRAEEVQFNQDSHSRPSRTRGRRDDAVLPPQDANAGRDRAGRNARSTSGGGRVARRGTRLPRSRR
jgi:AcrR family transcriptional regulator